MYNKQNWEVISYQGNSTTPTAIRRISDQQEFKLGETVTNGTKMRGKIERFEYSFKSNDIFVYTDWSGIGMNLDSLSHVQLLPCKFQISQQVHFFLGTSSVEYRILAVHFYSEKVKYDLEITMSDRTTTRVYNVSENLLNKN